MKREKLGLPPIDDDAALHPALHPGDDGAAVTAATEAVKPNPARGRNAKTKGTDYRPTGWLRSKWDSLPESLPSGVIRDIGRVILQKDGLIFLQELIADPKAKDTDRLRAVETVAKLSVGFMTPDTMNAEDAPTLPPPIFSTTEGELPGGESAPVEEEQLAAVGGGGGVGAPAPIADATATTTAATPTPVLGGPDAFTGGK